MLDQNNIIVKDNFFSDGEIDKLLSDLKEIPYQESGTGGNQNPLSSFTPMHRRSQVKWIPKNKPFVETYRKISSFVKDVNKNGFGLKLTDCENIQFTKYSDNDWGTYNWHVDSMAMKKPEEENQKIRKLSTVIFLNDEDEFTGGNFLIDLSGGIRHIPQKKGTIIVFNSYMSHCVTPIIYGKRMSLVNWFSGPFEI